MLVVLPVNQQVVSQQVIMIPSPAITLVRGTALTRVAKYEKRHHIIEFKEGDFCTVAWKLSVISAI